MAAGIHRKPELQAIIFDIGRVIVRINPDRAFAPLAADLGSSIHSADRPGPAPAHILEMLQSDARWCDWQEGRMTALQWHEHISRQLRIPIGFAAFCAAWNATLERQTILDDAIFAKLSAHYRLALLSNTDPLHSEYLEEHFSFIDYFPVRVYSCCIGKSKPSPAIYRAALAALEVDPASALYIDDIAEYANAARAMKMDAICFHHPGQLLQELAARGIQV